MRPWLEARGATISCTRFFSGEAIPALDGIDLLVVMGGPMSVNDETTGHGSSPKKVRSARRCGTAPATAEAMLVHCRDELVPAPCVQREQDIRAATAADYARINALADEVLDDLVGG